MVILLGCLKIFLCRILDVSLGTIKTVLTVKEKSLYAALIGFCEVFIWYLIVKDALSSDSPLLLTAVSYSAGYATGTFVGGKLAKTLVNSHVTVQVITSSRSTALLDALRDAGYGITVLDVNSSKYGDPKYMIMTNVDRKHLLSFESKVNELDERAFVLVQETKDYKGGYERAGK